MTADHRPSQDSLLKRSVDLYRRTLKRVAPLHRFAHFIASSALFPLLENLRGFRTMPDDPFWFRFELLTTRHEPETVAQFKGLIRPGMTILDVGAHVGYYARLAADLTGAGGRVIAFEPHPRNHALLAQNVAGRPQVTLMQVALSAEEGTAELHDYLMMSASGSLHYDQTLRDVQLSQSNEADFAPRLRDFQPQTFSVRTAAADDLLAEIGVTQVDVIKMDIEGAELGALRGMQGVIGRSPSLALVMEYNPLGLQAFGSEPVAALHEVLDFGFERLQIIEADSSLRDVTGDDEALQAMTERLMTNMGVVNVLFTKTAR